MKSSSKQMISLVVVATLSAGVAWAEGGSEASRYSELAESEGDFQSAVGAHRRGDLDGAARGYRNAITNDPAFVEAMVNLARVHIERGEPKEAAEWLGTAERQRPEYPGIHAARGLLALEEGNVVVAIDELSHARSRTPRDVEVLTNLAAALIMRGTNRAAIPVLEEARRLAPHRPGATYNLALGYDQLGDTPRATHHYKSYLSLAPTTDPQRALVVERIAVLTSAGTPEPGPAAIKLHSSSPASSTRTIVKGGTK